MVTLPGAACIPPDGTVHGLGMHEYRCAAPAGKTGWDACESLLMGSTNDVTHDRNSTTRRGRRALLAVGLVVATVGCGSAADHAASDDTGAQATEPAAARAAEAPSPTTTSPRFVDAPLEGDIDQLTEVLGVRSPSDGVRGTLVGDDGGGVGFVVGADRSFAIETEHGLVEARDRDGVMVTLNEATREAHVFEPPPEGVVGETNRVAEAGAIPDGAFAPERRPDEAPTTDDTLNLMLAPSFWLRATVLPYATSVTALGPEQVEGRSTQKYRIQFGGDALEEYADDGWHWWVDDDTGVLVRYEIHFRDAESGLGGATLRDLRFPSEAPVIRTPEIPAGYRLRGVVADDSGAPKPIDEVTATPVRAADLLDAAR